MAETLEDVDRRAARMGAEAFGVRHPGPFLVRLEDGPGRNVQWLPAQGSTQPGGKMLVPAAHAQCAIHELVKTSGKGAATQVVVGRGRESDVILPERSISMSHATFERVGDDGWRLKDTSRNGTRINGTRVPGPDAVVIKSGDVITLGDVPLLFVSTAQLLELLPAWRR